MRRLVRPVLVIVAVALIALAAYLLGGQAAIGTPPVTVGPAPTATAVPVSSRPPSVAQAAAPNQLVVEGLVAPVQSVQLSAPLAGIPVVEVLVREGDTVNVGDPLLRLDSRDLDLEVAEARAALSRVQAEYDRLAAGSSPAQIAEAEAQVAEARARQAQIAGQVTPADIEAARAAVEQARARLRQLEAGPRDAEVRKARAEVERARANLEQQRATLSARKEEARRLMEERANDLRNAQVTYSAAYAERQRNSGDDAQGQAAAEALARAELVMANAESALERAKVEYEARRQDEIAGLAAAEASVAAAQANLDLLLAGPQSAELASARAALVEAEARLARLTGGERAGALAAAGAGVAQAQARLQDLLTAPSTLALARAAVVESQVRLQQAELRLAQATLSAPIAGTVVAVKVVPGETPGGRDPVIVLADLSAWRVEVRALTDLEIVRVREGDQVSITSFALPDLALTGRVERIQFLSRSEQGQTHYTAVIAPDTWDDRLRWGMTVQVTFGA
ncbi:MAG: biotin/lipoyl-binding protein [Oscillochloridaceae bacterium]|nr:biotin/lipoyl-binding protein [Chloroflexaceae bacterium]MDW8388732.1 biotin/lipoyl-binding protein [Oscillochloridaceae bacterium]